jgi:hypothetical protein
MAYDFPLAPSIGDMSNGYAWDGEKWIATSNAVAENFDARYVNVTGDSMSGSLLPTVNGTLNLGSASFRWATLYTSDLSLSNGIGDWTIVEGEDDLFLYNNKRGKTYKFALIEVDQAPPKR